MVASNLVPVRDCIRDCQRPALSDNLVKFWANLARQLDWSFWDPPNKGPLSCRTVSRNKVLPRVVCYRQAHGIAHKSEKLPLEFYVFMATH